MSFPVYSKRETRYRPTTMTTTLPFKKKAKFFERSFFKDRVITAIERNTLPVQCIYVSYKPTQKYVFRSLNY